MPPPHPDQSALARAGATVRARLAADPTIYCVPSEDAELFAIPDAFTLAECARMMRLVDEVARPSELLGITGASSMRTSSSGDFDPADPFAAAIARRIDDLLGLPGAWGETLQGQRYLPGQEFRAHCDWLDPAEPYWQEEVRRGGQRSWTAMAFLNSVEEGGHTQFVDLGLSIEPKPGVLLAWNNARPDGTPNPATLHAGTPVVRGVKYVLTRWYRTRPFR